MSVTVYLHLRDIVHHIPDLDPEVKIGGDMPSYLALESNTALTWSGFLG